MYGGDSYALKPHQNQTEAQNANNDTFLVIQNVHPKYHASYRADLSL